MDRTGIKRKIDELGRLSVPISIRKELDLNEVEFVLDGDMVFLQKVENNKCVFCEETTDLAEFKSKYICKKCLDKIKKL